MLTINKGIQQSAVKVVVYGVEGIGKTTFASHFPAPLFLDLDRGSRRTQSRRQYPVTWLFAGRFAAGHPGKPARPASHCRPRR